MCLWGVGVVIFRKSLKDLSVFRFMYLVNISEYSTEFIFLCEHNVILYCKTKSKRLKLGFKCTF